VSRLLIDPGAITRGRLIGQGGYGKVYEGVWKRSIPVALKWLEVGLLSERDKADIMREAYIHSCAHNHPNVCQLYGLVLQDPGECVLVMERLEQNLQQLLRDDAVVLLAPQKYRLALDAANGMEHLHSKNIVHGDLKPSNLLVGKSGSLVVTDFGLSSISCVSLTAATMSAAHPLLSSSSTALSVWYSPPELLDNRSTRKTAAGDVYAFAMVLLEIFTGQDPYGVAEYQAVLHIVLSGGRPKVSDRVPPGCAALIRRCWDHDPEARPTFTEVVEALCALADAAA
jgi:serine/threonine protein kinase